MLPTTGDIDKLATLAAKPLTETLLQYHYPCLSGVLEHTGNMLNDLSEAMDTSMLLSAHDAMKEETNDLFREERAILFPLLLQLSVAAQASGGCQPFKAVKRHYTNLLAATQQLKSLLHQLALDLDYLPELCQIRIRTIQFEQAFVRIQNIKEQYLFSPFRNCGHCKTVQL